MNRVRRNLILPLIIVFVLSFLAKPMAMSWKDPSCVSQACNDPWLDEGCSSEVGSSPSAEGRGTLPGDVDFSLPTELGHPAPQGEEPESLSTLVMEATPPFTATDFIFLPYISKPRPPLGWVSIGPVEGDALLDIDVAPNDSSRLYASTRTGVYRSTDKGTHWELALAGFFRQLVIDPQQPNILYTGPADDQWHYGVYKSPDGGDNWTHYDEGMTCEDLAALSIAATDPTILFTGSF